MPENNVNKIEISEEFVIQYNLMFARMLLSYKQKKDDITDEAWLSNELIAELPEMSSEEAEMSSTEIADTIKIYDENLDSLNKAIRDGNSKEKWLVNKLKESTVGMNINEYGTMLQGMDDIIRQKNIEMYHALTVDGKVNMNSNLDGYIPENMLAKSTEMNGFLSGKNIQVEVRNSYEANSVDIRVKNLDTGNYQNYQVKFGKDAKATIALIKRGNYSNQRIVVPTEQLEEVQKAFPNKTITDRIDAFGAKSCKLTKENAKALQEAAQKDGILPRMDYNHYNTMDLAIALSKGAGMMALQSATITAGFDVVYKVMSGQEIKADETVEIALKTGADTGLKTVAAGALQVSVRKDMIKIIPMNTPTFVIANIACVGIENIKILLKVVNDEYTMSEGLDHMCRATVSMVAGLKYASVGATMGTLLGMAIPVVGIPAAVIGGIVGGVIGYGLGSTAASVIYNTAKIIAQKACNIVQAAWNKVKDVANTVVNKVANTVENIRSFLFG